MEPINIVKYDGSGLKRANYRLLDEPTKLVAKLHEPWVRPDGEGWEVVGMSDQVRVVTTEEANKQKIKVRPPRKQRAARAYVPKESIKVVPAGAPAPLEVAVARIEGKDETIAAMEARVRELMGIVAARKAKEQARVKAIAAFESIFNEKRTRA